MLLQYANDLLLTADSKETCREGSLLLLKHLACCGFKVSLKFIGVNPQCHSWVELSAGKQQCNGIFLMTMLLFMTFLHQAHRKAYLVF